ncbi:hypothetical protein GEMRC1_008180 [Eukaryota sp. GEM-RC1]
MDSLTWIECVQPLIMGIVDGDEDLSAFLKKHLHHTQELAFLPLFLCHRLPFFHCNRKHFLAIILGLPYHYREGATFSFATLKSKYRGLIHVPFELREKMKKFNTQSVDHFLSRISYTDSFGNLSVEIIFRWFFPNFDGSTPQPSLEELTAINYLLKSIKMRTVFSLQVRIDRFIGAFILLLKEPVNRKDEVENQTTESELFKRWEDLVNDRNGSRELFYDQIINFLNKFEHAIVTRTEAFCFMKESYELLVEIRAGSSTSHGSATGLSQNASA